MHNTLEIIPKRSILDGIQLFERIDKETLEELISGGYDLKLTEEIDERKKLIDINERLDERDLIKINYGHQNIPFTRLYAGEYGYQGMRRPVRGILAYKYYVDIDIENAHPSILKQVCKANRIQCTTLSDYVDNRDNHLKRIIALGADRDSAKDLFLRVMNGGKYETWATENNINFPKPTFIDNFERDIMRISEKIIKANEHLKRYTKPDKKLEGSVLSRFLQYHESIVLEAIFF